MLLTVLAAWRFGWIGLLLALGASFALFQTIATLQGEPWSFGHGAAESANPAIRHAYGGAAWAWVAGFFSAAFLFAGWCRRHLNGAAR